MTQLFIFGCFCVSLVAIGIQLERMRRRAGANSVVMISHVERSTIRRVVVEPWGMPFDLSGGRELRVSACGPNEAFFWNAIVDGEYLTLSAEADAASILVEEKRGAEWVELWNG